MAVRQTNRNNRLESEVSQRAAPGELKFGAGDGFQKELQRRGDRYFQRTGRRRRDCRRMYLKTAIVVGWLLTSYVLLGFVVGTGVLALPLAISVGLWMAALG